MKKAILIAGAAVLAVAIPAIAAQVAEGSGPHMMMKPDMTPLLIAAKDRGYKIHFGIHMLNSQLELMMQFLGLAPREGKT